jgi:hypothetical protein
MNFHGTGLRGDLVEERIPMGANAVYEQIDRRLSAVEGRLGDLDRKIDAVFFRLVTLMLGTWVTLMLAVLFAHK